MNLQQQKNKLLHYLKNNDLKSAKKIYTKYRDSKLADIELWQMFTNLNTALGNHEEIIHCCSRILEGEPGNIQALFNIAACNQNMRQFEKAIEYYRKCVAMDNTLLAAHINCMQLYEQTGKAEEAISFYSDNPNLNQNEQYVIAAASAFNATGDTTRATALFNSALSINPHSGKALFNLAHINYVEKKYSTAENLYKKYIQINSNDYRAYNNLGRLYDETGVFDKAIEMYSKAIKLDAKNALFYRNLAKSKSYINDYEGAQKTLKKCRDLDKNHPETYFLLGKIYSQFNQPEKAKQAFHKALELPMPDDIENPDKITLAIKYSLSAIEDSGEMQTGKNEFVKDLFDNYAETFEEHLVKTLRYKIPEVISEQVSKHIKDKGLNTIDLGCGTGLCAHFLRGYSDYLVGVDIAPKMIAESNKTGLYDSLITSELLDVIQNSETEFDLFIAADVFIYVGKLEEIFSSISQHISQKGFFIFSTESLPNDENDCLLYDMGRYKHSISYIEKLSNDYDFNLVDRIECVVRKENNVNVDGHVYVLSRQKLTS